MLSPTVSVIIPTYNRKVEVTRAVESVLEQRCTDFELIVVDDGSTDGTSDWLRSTFGDSISLIQQRQQGVSAARNRGVAACEGEFLSFLDSDDIWDRDKLSHQLQFHRYHPEFRVSQTQEIWIRNGRRVNPKKRHKKPSGDIFSQSLTICCVTPSSVMMRRDLFDTSGGFDEEMRACEDYDLWIRLTATHRVGLLDKNLLTKYGGHEDQLSRKFQAMDRFRVYALVKLLLSNNLTGSQKALVVATCSKKLTILIHGARKRGRNVEKLTRLLTEVTLDNVSPDFFRSLAPTLLTPTDFDSLR